MPTVAIFSGVILILTGIAGYAHGLTTGHASVTALIPAAIGAILAATGVLSGIKEGLKKHLMHVAVVVALIGFIATAGRLISRLGEISLSPAVLSQAATAAVCLIFMILAIRSFAAARLDDRKE